MSDMPQVGKTYICHHSRKGTFAMKVASIDGEWVTGELVAGRVEFLSSWADEVEIGNSLTVNHALSHWEECHE